MNGNKETILNATTSGTDLTQQTFQLPDGRTLAQKLPNVEAKFFPGEGHISLIHKNLRTIFETVTTQA
jgi:hypothetical protein